MVDCSHANSNKDHEQQPAVCHNVAAQIAVGGRQILGIMLESNLVAGSQTLLKGKTPAYGQSITDACIGWDTTVDLLNELAGAVRSRK
jgi:3-deoxy-7-phosphoheptulonate synthase